MSLKFYYSPMSSATRIHWALEELGVPYEKIKIDLAAGEQRKPEYLTLNPNGKVPLIVDEGLPIFESLAILLYLGERYGVDKGLFPAAILERAEAFKWMAWSSVTLGETGGRMMRNTSERFPAEQRNEKAGEAARKEIGEQLAIVDRALEGKEYLVGGKFSFADLSIASFVPFLGRLGVDIGPFKNIQALDHALHDPAGAGPGDDAGLRPCYAADLPVDPGTMLTSETPFRVKDVLEDALEGLLVELRVEPVEHAILFRRHLYGDVYFPVVVPRP